MDNITNGQVATLPRGYLYASRPELHTTSTLKSYFYIELGQYQKTAIG